MLGAMIFNTVEEADVSEYLPYSVPIPSMLWQTLDAHLGVEPPSARCGVSVSQPRGHGEAHIANVDGPNKDSSVTLRREVEVGEEVLWLMARDAEVEVGDLQLLAHRTCHLHGTWALLSLLYGENDSVGMQPPRLQRHGTGGHQGRASLFRPLGRRTRDVGAGHRRGCLRRFCTSAGGWKRGES